MVANLDIAEAGPFGSPDASRVDATDTYISISGAMPDLKDLGGRLRERIIVGKKGAGKTFYLRSLQRKMLDESKDEQAGQLKEALGWIVVKEQHILSSQEVIDFSRTSQRAHAQLAKLNIYVDQAARTRDLWTRVWECAILASIYSMVRSPGTIKSLAECRRRFRSDPELSEKIEYIADFLKGVPPSNSPVTHIKAILADNSKKANDLRSYVDRFEWTILYDVVASVISGASQIALFIDSIDDDFDEAPEPWLDCQEGLFRAIFSFLNKGDSFSNRVHVVVALREIVFSSLLHSEHASRYLWDSHVHYISWDTAASRAFFFEKIKMLPETALGGNTRDRSSDPISALLGFNSVRNDRRNIDESAASYILRHTRLVPRDIVLMGNAICSQIRRRKTEGKPFSQGKLRQIVHEVSRYIASEAILSCANEYISSVDYVAEILLGSRTRSGNAVEGLNKPLEAISDVDVDEIVAQIKKHVVSRVEIFVRSIGKEKFDKSEFHEALIGAELATASDFLLTGRAAFYRFDNVMYRHGLIAYQKAENGTYRWKFSWRDTPSIDNSQLPGSESYYGFHSSILDAFPGLSLDGRGPVS